MPEFADVLKRALLHPFVLIAWSFTAAIAYAQFPASDTNALITLAIWGAGALFWMAMSERECRDDAA